MVLWCLRVVFQRVVEMCYQKKEIICGIAMSQTLMERHLRGDALLLCSVLCMRLVSCDLDWKSFWTVNSIEITNFSATAWHTFEISLHLLAHFRFRTANVIILLDRSLREAPLSAKMYSISNTIKILAGRTGLAVLSHKWNSSSSLFNLKIL